MGNVVFWIIFVGFITLIFISSIRRNSQNRIERELELHNSFGRKTDLKIIENVLRDNVKGYCNYVKSDSTKELFEIDDITWNDLNLSVIYNTICDSILSSAGEEYLYYKFRVLPQKVIDSGKFYEDLLSFTNDEAKRTFAQNKIDKLGKLKVSDSFEIIEKLFGAQKNNIASDIVKDIILLVFFMLIFVWPPIGMLGFIIMLIVCISSYFKGKSAMDENLKAFSYCIRLIKCRKELDSIVNDENEYCKELDDICKMSWVFMKGDGTTSNPFSIIMDYIRMIFHVDLILYNKRLNQIRSNKENIINIYEYIGYIDAVIAVASYVKSLSYVCKVNIAETGEKVFDVKELYHPLCIDPVSNSIFTEGGVLITGSNASGKSTFLKAVGINVIFAQTFGFAFAKSYNSSILKLYSSMAISDNLIGNESYYVVESKSLKRICDEAGSNDNIICIVDEVLKGTNTEERIAASTEILRYLRKCNVICFVATHDTELTSLLKDTYDMYYFTEEIKDGNVYFPYNIREGKLESGNAIRLLEELRYEKEITDSAIQLISYHRKKGKWVE